jgi:DNA modification methylase
MTHTYLPGPNATAENGVYCGDSRELAAAIPDASIDAIITDPVYQHIDQYAWLGQLAMRVLRPDRPLLVFNGIGYLPQVTAALQQAGLTYRWQIAIAHVVTRYTRSRHWIGYLRSGWISLTWWDKGKAKLHARVYDSMPVTGTKAHDGATHDHPWEKGQRWLYYLARAFAHPDGVTLDPFCGSGSVPATVARLGRSWLAFDIEPDNVQTTRERLAAIAPEPAR